MFKAPDPEYPYSVALVGATEGTKQAIPKEAPVLVAVAFSVPLFTILPPFKVIAAAPAVALVLFTVRVAPELMVKIEPVLPPVVLLIARLIIP